MKPDEQYPILLLQSIETAGMDALLFSYEVFTHADVPVSRLSRSFPKTPAMTAVEAPTPLSTSCRPDLLFLPATLPPVKLAENGGNYRIGKQKAIWI